MGTTGSIGDRHKRRMSTAYIGIDVQSKRSCAYAALDDDLWPGENGWLAAPEEAPAMVNRLRDRFAEIAVGIDAPRCSLPSPREHYWNGRAWRARRPSERGYGRHCEVVLAASRIANPQWTPVAKACHTWMHVGFRLFTQLSALKDVEVHEVFPTAAYTQLADDSGDALLSVSLKGFAGGPKDMLDAYVAAYTVREYLAGRGTAVGGGDGLGEIILPRPLPGLRTAVLHWPGPGK